MEPFSQGQEQLTAWGVPGISGLDCFRAQAMTHHYGRHSHEGYGIGIVEAGVGGNFYRGSAHYFPAGHIIVMNPDEAHTGYAAGDQPLTYRMFYLTPAALREMLPEQAALPFFQEVGLDNSYWSGQLRRLHRLLETPGEPLEQQSQLIEILAGFTQVFGHGALTEVKGHEPQAIHRIKTFLQAHYWRQVSLEELTQLTHLSRAYLIRSFRQAVGIPPYTYLLQLRVERAKQLLATGLPIAQVAQAVGFVDQSHLNRHFKSITGLTPRQYAMGHYRTRNSRKFLLG